MLHPTFCSCQYCEEVQTLTSTVFLHVLAAVKASEASCEGKKKKKTQLFVDDHFRNRKSGQRQLTGGH